MRSKIYEGYIEHIRYKPVWHRLSYPLYFYCFDLDELEYLDKSIPLFGYNRYCIVSLYDSDFLQDGPGSIREKVLRHLQDSGFAEHIARVVMITSARFLSRVFNPVSFYYCLSSDNKVVCMVAEVNNTYGERHVYVMKNEASPGEYPVLCRIDKAFHVSPFNDLQGRYEMSFSGTGQEIDIHVDLHRSDETVFGAKLFGKARELTLMNQALILFRHPFIPHLTMPRIYIEAAKLHFSKKLNMYDKPAPVSTMTIRKIPPTLLQKQCMNALEKLLVGISKGSLEIVQTDGAVKSFGDKEAGHAGRIMINDNRFYPRVLFGGDVGFGETFMDGYWDTGDLVGLYKVLIDNRSAISEGNSALSAVYRMSNYAMDLLRKNTIPGSRKNIEDHYDLSNKFFKTFLDEDMTYSCGLFLTEHDTLEQAQKNKIHSVIDKAAIRSTDHVLEIGCGWGSFAIEAVKRTGCRVTGITISRQQLEYARRRVKEEGLEDRIDILFEDYRRVQGLYDRIVSIEMLEAVGHEYLGAFFASCDRVLVPDGLAVIQVITIPDNRYKRHMQESNWIKKHIFPGGHLPSLTALCDAMTAHSSLMIQGVENIALNYAKTLRQWCDRLIDADGAIAAMGFDRSFRRKWRYYFSICEAQFALRVLSNLQIVLAREGNTSLPG
ncbi:MAG: DUF1365 family protein [Deltaproteobacteria bacterium]|nr:DUF1365 family protein [Deltaproteobacteria bacterium]